MGGQPGVAGVFGLALVVFFLDVHVGDRTAQAEVAGSDRDGYVAAPVVVTRHEQRDTGWALSVPVVVLVAESDRLIVVERDGALDRQVPALQFAQVGCQHKAPSKIVCTGAIRRHHDRVRLRWPRASVCMFYFHEHSNFLSVNRSGVGNSEEKHGFLSGKEVRRVDAIDIKTGACCSEEALSRDERLIRYGYSGAEGNSNQNSSQSNIPPIGRRLLDGKTYPLRAIGASASLAIVAINMALSLVGPGAPAAPSRPSESAGRPAVLSS